MFESCSLTIIVLIYKINFKSKVKFSSNLAKELGHEKSADNIIYEDTITQKKS